MQRAVCVVLIVIGLAHASPQPVPKLALHVVPTPIMSYRLLAMSMDDDGCIWAGAIHRVVHRYDPRTGTVVDVPLPFPATASACICVGKKFYILGQSYPRLIIYDRTKKQFSEVAYPSAKPNVWYGTEAIDGRHIFFFDRGGAGVIKWDTQTDSGNAIPWPYQAPFPGGGRYEPRDQALWCHVWDFTGGKYQPLGMARLDIEKNQFTGFHAFPKDDTGLQPYTDPATTLFVPYTLKGKVVPFDWKEKRWCQFLDVPQYGKLFGFMGGPVPHQGRYYFSLSTYNGTDTGCDGKPYHFCNAILEFDPQARRFMILTLEAKDAYYQIAYMLSARGEFFATGSNILDKDGKLNRDRKGEVVFWQTVKPSAKRALEHFKKNSDKTMTPAQALAVSSTARPADEAKEKSPAIAFSKNETTVSVHYDKGEWTFHRPVVSRWDFKASGTVRWVANTGNDANDGSTDNPFRTIGKAVEKAGPGDVIHVRAGTYVESILIRKSGQEGKPLILSCAPGDLGQVKITPPKEYVQKNPSGAVIRVHSAHHVWINGLVIEGPMGRPEAPATEMYGANGITFAGKGGLGCRVTNCVVYGNVHCGIKEMGHGGTNILLEANVIFGNGTRSTDHGIYCPADELTINGNIIFQNAGYGIHSYSHPKRQIITRNICLGNKAAGIILAGSENRVYHNVCVYNGLGILYFRGGCTGNVVKNNIFAFNKVDCGYDNGGGKYGDPARNVDDFNCYFPGKPDERIGPGKHEVLADPLFVDPKKGDFRLKADSPCQGKGVDVGMDKAPDLGAFFK